MSISYATRQAICDLPGKTAQRWKDGDERCHCTHCDLCGDLYRTVDIELHERECQAALLKALERSRVVGDLSTWVESEEGLMVQLWDDGRGTIFCNLAPSDGSPLRTFHGRDCDKALSSAATALKAGKI